MSGRLFRWGKRPKAEDTLKPRQVRFGAQIGTLSRWIPFYLFIFAGQVLAIGNDLPSWPQFIAAVILLLGALLGFRRLARVGEETSKRRSKVWEPYKDTELREVVPQLEKLGNFHEIRVLHHTGEGVPLTPEFSYGRLVITKRFWTELSPAEQRFSLDYVRYKATIGGPETRWVLYGVALFFVVVGFCLWWFGDRKLRFSGAIALVGAPFIWFAGHRYADWSAQTWLKNAQEAGDLNAPITLLEKLIEEENSPKRLALLKSELERYRASLPEGAHRLPPATQPSDEQSSSVEVRGG